MKIYRHRKRKTTYVVVARPIIEAHCPMKEDGVTWEPPREVTYLGLEGSSGIFWSRPQPEFDDGRFEEIGEIKLVQSQLADTITITVDGEMVGLISISPAKFNKRAAMLKRILKDIFDGH
jgi:hypothetical protein